MIVTHNTTINLTCRATSDVRALAWFANETWVSSLGDRYRVSTSDGVDKTVTLTINGNLTCETVNVYCEVITTERQFVHMHNTTLMFQGWLHSILLFGMSFRSFPSLHCELATSIHRSPTLNVHIKEQQYVAISYIGHYLSLYYVSHRSSSFT